MQSLVRAIYPAQCASCGEIVEGDGGLCAPCWRETQFVLGHVCDKCGVSLPGETDGEVDYCDDCIAIARPWSKGRTALVYSGKGRKLVLALKHADRLDIVPAAAEWMARAAEPLIASSSVVVPVPTHWTRMFRRKYNQAAELGRAIARSKGLTFAPNALVRVKSGETQEGKDLDARFANMQKAFRPHPSKSLVLDGKSVLIVDDVMTSGATLASATEAARSAGASEVNIVTLARVAKDT